MVTRFSIADAYYDNFLLFTDTYQKQIYQMSLASEDFHAIPLEGHVNPIAVDYDPLHRKVSLDVNWNNLGTVEELFRTRLDSLDVL